MKDKRRKRREQEEERRKRGGGKTDAEEKKEGKIKIRREQGKTRNMTCRLCYEMEAVRF